MFATVVVEFMYILLVLLLVKYAHFQQKPARVQIQEQGDGEAGIIHQDELQAEDVETSKGSHGEEVRKCEVCVPKDID